jgi:uncharacterized protein YggU (UPF0235/DUF167 family)
MEHPLFTIQAGGILLRVKVKAGARRDAVLGVRAGELVVCVRAAPEKGKANAAVAAVLSRFLGQPRSSVVLKSGGGSPRKLFSLPLAARGAVEAAAERFSGEGT